MSFHDFYLAGGTGLYCYYQHRESRDLYFFTRSEFDEGRVREELKAVGAKIVSLAKGTVYANIGSTKFSFISFGYDMLKPLLDAEGFKVASVDDIAAMKMSAITQRGAKRDFVDICYIMKETKWSGADIVSLSLRKFPELNRMLLLKSIMYFEDAEEELMPKMLKRAFTWKEIKEFIKVKFKAA